MKRARALADQRESVIQIPRPESSLLEGHERTILAYLMSRREACAKFLHRISSHIFSVPSHQTIVHAIQDVFEEGDKVNLVTVTQRLSELGKLAECGGESYITQIFIATTDAELAESALECVLDEYRKREAAKIGRQLDTRDIEPKEAEKQLALLHGRNGDLPEGIPLMTLAESPPDPENTMLGNRYLCRGGIMFFVGPSGVGKSSASAQQDILWSLGRPAFHIRPTRPLRILCIQAENDDGDLSEMASGVCEGLKLTKKEREIVRQNVIYVSDCSHTADEFLRTVECLLQNHAPIEILRIDPLHAYLGGDILSVEVTSKFLRTGLNSILRKFRCAAIINHHTPKPTIQDKSNWRPSDWMYFGAGNADLTNTPRATLSMDATHAPDVFEFRAGKRGRRIGWVDENGEPMLTRLFCWDKGDAIYWRDATDGDVDRVQSLKPRQQRSGMVSTGTIEDLLSLIPVQNSIEKNVLLQAAAEINRGNKRIGLNKGRAYLTELIDAGRAFEWRIKRAKTNPRIEIARYEQPD